MWFWPVLDDENANDEYDDDHDNSNDDDKYSDSNDEISNDEIVFLNACSRLDAIFGFTSDRTADVPIAPQEATTPPGLPNSNVTHDSQTQDKNIVFEVSVDELDQKTESDDDSTLPLPNGDHDTVIKDAVVAATSRNVYNYATVEGTPSDSDDSSQASSDSDDESSNEESTHDATKIEDLRSSSPDDNGLIAITTQCLRALALRREQPTPSEFICDGNAFDLVYDISLEEILFDSYTSDSDDSDSNDSSDDDSISDETAIDDDERRKAIDENKSTFYALVDSVKAYANDLRPTLEYNFQTVYCNMVKPFILYI